MKLWEYFKWKRNQAVREQWTLAITIRIYALMYTQGLAKVSLAMQTLLCYFPTQSKLAMGTTAAAIPPECLPICWLWWPYEALSCIIRSSPWATADLGKFSLNLQGMGRSGKKYHSPKMCMKVWMESLSWVVVMQSEVGEGLQSWCMSKRVFQLLSVVFALPHQLPWGRYCEPVPVNCVVIFIVGYLMYMLLATDGHSYLFRKIICDGSFSRVKYLWLMSSFRW